MNSIRKLKFKPKKHDVQSTYLNVSQLIFLHVDHLHQFEVPLTRWEPVPLFRADGQ